MRRFASHRGNVKLGELWWQKSERDCRSVKHVNLFGVFGTYRAIFPISSTNPKKFNMFNISAVSLTFFSPKPTKFNITAVGVICNVKLGDLWWQTSERNCRNVQHVKLFGVFGTYRAIFPISSKNPKKFNMFNISAVSLTFFSPKPTKFNTTAVGVIS